MTNGLGQQQFNLSNLSAREHLLQFRIFVYHRFRDKQWPRVLSARYVDCSSGTFREAAIYPESYPESYLLSFPVREMFQVTASEAQLSRYL